MYLCEFSQNSFSGLEARAGYRQTDRQIFCEKHFFEFMAPKNNRYFHLNLKMDFLYNHDNFSILWENKDSLYM